MTVVASLVWYENEIRRTEFHFQISKNRDLSMIIKPSDEFLKSSKGQGKFACELPFPPDHMESDSIQLKLATPKLQLTASSVRPEGSFYFSFGIPKHVLDGPDSTIAIGPQSNLVSANLVYLSGDGGFHSYAGASGTIEFAYSQGEQRLEADFNFKAIEGEVFEGKFHVVGFDSLKKSETSKSTGSFSAELPDPVVPSNFVADNVELDTYRPGSRLAFHGFNTTAYSREYAFALSLPSNMEVGVTKVYDVGLYPDIDGKAMAGLVIGSNDGPVNIYLGVSGAIEATYTPSEKRLQGKFFYLTIGGKKFEGTFNIVY